MNFYSLLQRRQAQGRPVGVALIGAGKFGSMYLAQTPKIPGVHVVGIADISPANALANLSRVGWDKASYSAQSLDKAAQEGTTHVTDDWQRLVAHPAVEVVVEATGYPPAAVEHILESFREHKSVVNVTVEADALCGLILAKRAAEADVVYSLAYGDQPAIVCELVDWARAAGFLVAAAGRGHKWLDHYARSTPETVWDHWGLTREQARIGGLNPKMFNSFLDGSKPAIECTAISNATGLTPAPSGLAFPPSSVDDLPFVMRPKDEGGQLHHKGQVEVASSLERDGRVIPKDIRQGMWVVVEGDTEYIRRCFVEYGMKTDPTGRYASLYRPWHLIGLEVGISVASVALRREPTGCPTGFRADVVATAKRDLNIGELLDGEGGYTVYGKLLPAADSLALQAVPLGLAHDLKLIKPVAEGQTVTWEHVGTPPQGHALQVRREMEEQFSPVATL